MLQDGVFQIYSIDSGSYSWWLLDEEGGIIAHAPEQYDTVPDCVAVIERVKRLAGRATIQELPIPSSDPSAQE